MKFWTLLGLFSSINLVSCMPTDNGDEVKADEELIVNGNTASKFANALQLTNKQKTAIVNRHNEHRKQVEPKASNMRKLSWDQELAKMSMEFTQKCSYERNKDMEHSRFNRVGENLYISLGIPLRTDLFLNAVSAWFNQHIDYDFMKGRCEKGKFCGGFTQVVWADTFKVGCGVTSCSKINVHGVEWKDAILFACHYGPAGNFNKRPYKPGLPCDECHNKDECRDSLCENDMRDSAYSGDIVASWDSWSNWSPCSQTCFGGFSRRHRICNSFVDSDCDGSTTELSYTCGENLCNKFGNFKGNPAEKKWLSWEPWSGCSVSCGVGIETRMRKCRTNERCNGINKLTVSCDKGKCPNSGWSKWNAWSSCNVTCGSGYQKRTRQCRGLNPCRGANEMKRPCNGDLCATDHYVNETVTSKAVETSGPLELVTTETSRILSSTPHLEEYETSSPQKSASVEITTHPTEQSGEDETTSSIESVSAEIATTQSSKFPVEFTLTTLETIEDDRTTTTSYRPKTATVVTESVQTGLSQKSRAVTTKPIDLFITTSTAEKHEDKVLISDDCCKCCGTCNKISLKMIRMEEQNLKIQRQRLEVEKMKLDIHTKMYELMKKWKI